MRTDNGYVSIPSIPSLLHGTLTHHPFPYLPARCATDQILHEAACMGSRHMRPPRRHTLPVCSACPLLLLLL
jgi:hypothetical protein